MIINVEQLDPFSLPSVAIENRNSLPEIPAIYFAVSKEHELLYIGRAVLLQKRWKLHHRVKQLESLKDVQIAWLACNDLTDQEMNDLEQSCIKHFMPILNQTVIPGDVRSPGAMFNIKNFPIGADEQIDDLVEWGLGSRKQVFLMALDRYWEQVKQEKQERESQMSQDQYEVRVERVGREFVAWQGHDEQLSKEQFELWKSQENVEKVGRFVNGSWAEAPYTPRVPK